MHPDEATVGKRVFVVTPTLDIKHGLVTVVRTPHVEVKTDDGPVLKAHLRDVWESWEDAPKQNPQGLTFGEWVAAASPATADRLRREVVTPIVNANLAIYHGVREEFLGWFRGEDPSDWRSA